MGGCLSSPQADEPPAKPTVPPPAAAPAAAPPTPPPAEKPLKPASAEAQAPAAAPPALPNDVPEPAKIAPSQMAQPVRAPVVQAPEAAAVSAPTSSEEPAAAPASIPAEDANGAVGIEKGAQVQGSQAQASPPSQNGSYPPEGAPAAAAPAAAEPEQQGDAQDAQQAEDDQVEAEEAEEAYDDGGDYIELQEYSFQDLVDASSNFQEDAVLGEGGFGKVYKGIVTDRYPRGGGPPVQATVAIKKLNPAGYQSKVEWMREILILGKLNHPNLVRLIGYCADLEEMLLVYEFVPRGSLDYHLWPGPNSNTPPLPWQARLRIAHDAACGLAYLHSQNFIHRDFKAPNILLDEDYSSKLTDFGLAKDGPDAGQTHVSTQIMGTMGYLDPRYAETGQLTVKSDVYAYGVVLLELLTGKKAMGISPTGKPKTLTSWARPYLNRPRPDLESLVDPNMIDPYPEKVARTLAISAKHCIHDDTNMRPMMTDIVDTLRPLNMAINGPR